MQWETVIGLEVHVQLNTQTKIFSGAATAYGASPNTQASAVDLALPGVLPVLNKAVVEKAIQFGLAIGAQIQRHSVFDRKNYFYPDLPKGYQITQFERPLVLGGRLEMIMPDGEVKNIAITHAHLEEDAGKSLHEDFHGMTGIDLNRAGTPLLEVVSEPDMRSAAEAVAYLKALHSLVKYLNICDGNMQEGSFRCDANVSVRPMGQTELGTRAEIKNVNSFRFVEKAILYEVERQIEILQNGGTIAQETRLYDATNNVTRSMRDKESANDYRYFPDPDLLPLVIEERDIETIRAGLPELPHDKRIRFESEYGLGHYDASLLISTRELAQYFEEAVRAAPDDPKLAANWIMGDLSANLNKHDLDIQNCPVPPEQLGRLIARIKDSTISGKIAKTVFEALWNQEGTVDEIIRDRGLQQVTDSAAIESIIDEIIQAYPQQYQDYQDGKTKLFGFFVGQVMKVSKGKANPQQVNELLEIKLRPND